MSPKQDAYDVITNRVLEALEGGHIPWQKPWRSVRGEAPTSLSTGRPYSGINVWMLSLTAHLEGYTSPFWGTFNQLKEIAVKQARSEGREIVEELVRGRKAYFELVDGEKVPFRGGVRKGEHGTNVVLLKRVEAKKDQNGDVEKEGYSFLRYYSVFNADQCDGLGLEVVEDELPERDPIASAEAIVAGYKGCPEVRSGGNSAHYSPALDYVQMPKIGQFDSSELYYSTLLHELVHSTGHKDRLNRETLISPLPFGSEDYSKEELVAEMGAAYLNAEAGLEVELEHSAGYIQHWLGVLKNDKKLLVSAASQAQKASDHILGI